jgi:hypothetical protein
MLKRDGRASFPRLVSARNYETWPRIYADCADQKKKNKDVIRGNPWPFLTFSMPAIFLVLLVDVVIRHASNVIADNPRERLLRGFFLVTRRQIFRLRHP